MDDGQPGDFPPPQDNPWTTRATRLIYENAWMRVEENEVTRPDGKPGIYGVVHPANLALGVVPVDAEGHVWLVGQYRYPLAAYSWEIPEGGGDPDLDPQTEAARELREETGFTAGRWTRLLELDTSNCITAERAVVFLAEDLTAGTSQPDGSEQLQLVRVPLARAVDAALDGRITDAISVAGLLAAARHFSP